MLGVFLLGHWIFGWKLSASGISTSNPPSGKTTANKFDATDPTLHFSRLALTEQEAYEGRGRNIFASYGEHQPGKTAPQPRPMPAPLSTPPLPAIGLKLFGIAVISGLPRQACLSQAGDIFIGGEGDIVDRRYKLLRMGTDTVEVQDLLGNNKYTPRLRQ